jgi:drug/metabolite transporter (DMT)-like permease
LRPFSRRLEGFLLVALSGCSFGTLGIFNRLAAARGVDTLTTLTVRFVLAALLLWALTLPRRSLRRDVRSLDSRRLAGFCLMGSLFVAEAGFFFISSRRIPVALTALLLYLYPAIVLLLSWALGRERPAPSGVSALCMTLAGIALTVGSPASRLDLLGLVLGMASSLGYSIYMLLGERLQEGTPPLVASTWITTSAALIFLAHSLAWGRLDLAAAGRALPWLGGLALFGTVLPLFTLMAGLTRLTATQASIASTVEPVAAAILAAIVLGERLAPIQWAGGGLVLLGVVLLGSRRS